MKIPEHMMLMDARPKEVFIDELQKWEDGSPE